ncbi:MAG: type VI secretion system tube protein Hcp [Pseudomonadales bacterium]|nr:type VI secretion system tube protein Hcp [Pseudomonadales bacterium]
MALDQFLKLDGIDGEAVDATHGSEIDVISWTFGASQSGTTHMGPGGGAGKVNVQDLSISKYIDRSSPDIFQVCNTGKHIAKARLVIRKAGENPLEYYVIYMEDCLITSISTGGSGGEDHLTENISINFSKFKIFYTPQMPDGSAGAEIEIGFNIAENTPW